MEESVLPELEGRTAGRVLRRRVLRVGGTGESAVEELVTPVDPDTPLYQRQAGECTPYSVLPGLEPLFYETAEADPEQFERITRTIL